MDGFPGSSSDWSQTLKLLQSEDEMLVYQGCMELRDALSYAQENQMSGFSTDSYMDILVKIVQRDPMTDLSNEVKFFAIQCLTTLMDIFPQLTNALVNAGLVKHMANVLQSSFGFVDLSEACIKAYEKIAMENPPAVLRSGAIGIILQQMDFFEVVTQQRVLKIVQRIAKHSTCESDFDTYILPIMPYICMNLSPDNIGADSKKIEDMSRIVCEMQESFYLFYNPVIEFEKVADQYNKFLTNGLFDILLEHIRQYAEVNLKIQVAKELEERNEADQPPTDQIDSTNSNHTLTLQTMLNFFQVLENACRYSVRVSAKLFGESLILKDIRTFLPSNLSGKRTQYNSDEYPLINEAISLLNSLLSDKLETSETQEETKESENPMVKRVIQKKKYEQEKREYQQNMDNRIKIIDIAENLLPRIFFVFESTINPQQRVKTLQVIEKIISLFDAELLKNFVDPRQFAGFIVQIIRSKSASSIDSSLKITKKVIDCGSDIFIVPFIRHGVGSAIKHVSTEDNLRKYLGISKQIKITDKSFDSNIHEVKEALHFTRLHNPNDQFTRDFYERRLLDLVEKQKQNQSTQKASSPSETKKNIITEIIDLAQVLLKEYFENEDFIQKIKESSEQVRKQMVKREELFEVSEQLCAEACTTQVSMNKMEVLNSLLNKVGDLLTDQEFAITSYEFASSKLLVAFELLFTKSPSQSKLAIDRMKRDETGEEVKHSDEIELAEAQKRSKQVTKKESRCLINRLKLFTHIMLNRRGNSTPMKVLIELSKKIVSENDQFLLSSGVSQHIRPPPGFIGHFHPGGHGFHSGSQFGDYDHCINALKMLQKKATINLVYDSSKSKSSLPKVPEGEVVCSQGDAGKDQPMKNQEAGFDDMIEEGNQPNAMKMDIKKGQSHHPELMKLAGSPQKENMEKSKLNSSKVFMKRHTLYTELKQISVTVEQSSCVQILEDFLRNRIKTIENVKSLKHDFGFSQFGNHGQPGGLLGSMFGSQYQQINQKIQRKSLTAEANRMLDSFNERLAKILNQSSTYKLKPTVEKEKRIRRIKNEEGMEEAEAEKNSSDSGNEEREDEDDDDYGDEDMEDEQDTIEKQQMLDDFVEDVSDDIVNSDLPEEQQHLIVKFLTKQHTFMLDQIKTGIIEQAHQSDGDEHVIQIQEDEIMKIEEKLEDFQDTMERVQTRFFDKKEEDRQNKEEADDMEEQEKADQEKEKKEEGEDKKQGLFTGLSDAISSDMEMVDESEEANEGKKDEGNDTKKQEEAEPSEKKDNKPETKEKKNEPTEQQKKSEADTKEEKKDSPRNENKLEQIEEVTIMPLGKPGAPKKKLDSASKTTEDKGFDIIMDNFGAEQMLLGEKHDILQHISEEVAKQKIKDLKQDFDSQFDQKMEKFHEILKIKRQQEQNFEKDSEELERKRMLHILEMEREFRRMHDQKVHVKSTLDEAGVSEQTQEIMDQDLEDLIKQQGEDIDFEFFFEGKLIQPNQSIFEVIKDSEIKKRTSEKAIIQNEQVKRIQQKIDENRTRSQKITETGGNTESELDMIRRENERLKELMVHIQSMQSNLRDPIGFISSTTSHNIVFSIKDKADDVSDMKRKRLDSLAELTQSSFARARSKSEVIKDVSSSTINEFVQQIIDHEFKVFEKEEEDTMIEEVPLENDQVIEPEIQQLQKQKDDDMKKKLETARVEKEEVERALKILKMVNFLFSNPDLISQKGIQFIMKAQGDDADVDESPVCSPVKGEGAPQDIMEEFNDLQIKTGFSEIQCQTFIHQKLDSYLQRSIMDPYNLVQGGISKNLQEIFKNCPFLFPFQTKQLYFKLVSFISAIDAHRAIYFLRQFIKQQGGAGIINQHEKDNLKKIAKKKAIIRRDKLIPSAFALITKIDKRSFLEFEFQGEEGVGLGPTLEFYDNIAEEFKTWKVKVTDSIEFNMWRMTPDNMLFPSPICIKSFPQETIKQIYEIYRLCGTLVAKAIVDDRQIDLPISPLFWRLCLGHKMTIFDMKKLDESIFGTLAEFQIISGRAAEIAKKSNQKKLDPELKERQLKSLILSNGSQVEDYALDFTLPCYSHIELFPKGAERDVKLENAQDYVDLVLHFTFHETIKIQVQAFKKGFNAIFPISSLAPFTNSRSSEDEIETMICGTSCAGSEWTKEELIKNIEPDHGYTRKSIHYNHFIRYIIEHPNKPEFLKFLTGSKRLPIGGFKALQPHLTIVVKTNAQPDSTLPSVMSCQNYVKCPMYSSYEVFKQRFDYAVTEGQQNFTLS